MLDFTEPFSAWKTLYIGKTIILLHSVIFSIKYTVHRQDIIILLHSESQCHRDFIYCNVHSLLADIFSFTYCMECTCISMYWSFSSGISSFLLLRLVIKAEVSLFLSLSVQDLFLSFILSSFLFLSTYTSWWLNLMILKVFSSLDDSIFICKRITVFLPGSGKKSIGLNIELTAALVQMSILCANIHSCVIPGSVFIFALMFKTHC